MATKTTTKKPVESKIKKTKSSPSKSEGKSAGKKGEYFYAVGRRKRSIATVRLYPKGKGIITIVNTDKTLEEHIPVDIMQEAVRLPLKAVGHVDADVTVKVVGGGIHGQAEAIRLGIARALLKLNPDYRATLKPLGVLTRDPREKERKKYGLKKARRAPQFSKR